MLAPPREALNGRNKNRLPPPLLLLFLLALTPLTVAADAAPNGYTLQGTLLALPAALMPSGVENDSFVYQPFEFAMRIENIDGASRGNTFSVFKRSAFARVYAAPPFSELSNSNDDTIHLRIESSDHTINVPRAPWLPGDERRITQPVSTVYFEDGPDGLVVRRELPDMPPLGVTARVRTIDAPLATDDHLAKALAETVSFEFADTHIEEVAAYFSEHLSLPVAVDPSVVKPRAAARADGSCGYVTDGVIAYVEMEHVPLSEALTNMLRPLELGYELLPGYIWITSRDGLRVRSDRKRQTAEKDTALLEIEVVNASIGTRETLQNAPHLPIGKPNVQILRGTLNVSIPVNQWVLIDLDSGAPSLNYVLLLRATAETTENDL